MCAVAIPGNSLGEEVIVGGLGNFFQIFNNLLLGRVLLSWFPAAQTVGFLQPLFSVCDPYLNLFRNLIPPIGGIDLSPLLAFTFLREFFHLAVFHAKSKFEYQPVSQILRQQCQSQRLLVDLCLHLGLKHHLHQA